MKKKVSDIIDNALNLTQVNDSEALDWKRKVDICSTALRSVYDTIAAHEDNFMLTSFHTERDTFDLPDDLYTIRDVNRNGRTLTRADHFDRLRGDEFRVYNNVMEVAPGMGGVQVVYTVSPPDLTYPIAPHHETRDALRLNGRWMAVHDGGAITLTNLATDEREHVYEPPPGHEIQKFDMLPDGNLVLLVSGTLAVYDPKADGMPYTADGVLDFLLDSSCYVLYETGDHVIELFEDLGTRVDARPFAPYWEGVDTYVRLENGTVESWSSIEDGWIPIMDAEALVVDKNGAFAFYRENGVCYVSNGPAEWTPHYSSITEISSMAEHGEGYNAVNSVMGRNAIVNVYPDTMLDYPNTAYYDLIEAKLAEEIMVQMRQDHGTMAEIRREREEKLISMLARNRAAAYRIPNRYTRGSMGGIR